MVISSNFVAKNLPTLIGSKCIWPDISMTYFGSENALQRETFFPLSWSFTISATSGQAQWPSGTKNTMSSLPKIK